MNGIDNKIREYDNTVSLNVDDRHLFGDSISRNTTRKEYLSFLSITEVAFYKGAFINSITDSSSKQ